MEEVSALMQAAYYAFLEQLTATLQADERVLGLVLLGSTASQRRQPDQWSDHDFFVITLSGVQEDFRTRIDWLPDHDSIVLTIRETAHGLKVLYDSGHLIEYAIFDLPEIAVARVNDYAVVFDRGGVQAAIEQVIVPPVESPYTSEAMQRDMGLFLCLLLIGAGRVARGEVLSGQLFIRSHALSHLLTLLAHQLPAPDKSALDNLDVYRRFERVFPQLGAEIQPALALEPIHAALALLDLFERELSDTDAYPSAAAATVRRVLESM